MTRGKYSRKEWKYLGVSEIPMRLFLKSYESGEVAVNCLAFAFAAALLLELDEHNQQVLIVT